MTFNVGPVLLILSVKHCCLAHLKDDYPVLDWKTNLTTVVHQIVTLSNSDTVVPLSIFQETSLSCTIKYRNQVEKFIVLWDTSGHGVYNYVINILLTGLRSNQCFICSALNPPVISCCCTNKLSISWEKCFFMSLALKGRGENFEFKLGRKLSQLSLKCLRVFNDALTDHERFLTLKWIMLVHSII
jgi:hypothetical protein